MASPEHEGRLREERERAHQARIILEHPLWVAAWDEFTAEIEKRWRESRADDAEGREALYLTYRAAHRARNALETHIKTGRMADMELEKHG